MPLHYRRATVDDIPRAAALLEKECHLLSPVVCGMLPQLLCDLIERQRITLGVIEDSVTAELYFLGGSGFLAPSFLETALEQSGNLLELAFLKESQEQPAFLNTKQVAEANRRTDLRLLNFFGDPSKLNLNLYVGFTLDMWNFFHRGFQFKEMWAIVAEPSRAALMSSLKAPMRLGTLGAGNQYWLFRFTREDAEVNPAPWPYSVMITERPRFGFTLGQQQLLEMALLDNSDRLVETRLRLSPDAVKKRWRSVYAKVARVEPELLPPGASGSDCRRILLQRLRQNLEELRPW